MDWGKKWHDTCTTRNFRVDRACCSYCKAATASVKPEIDPAVYSPQSYNSKTAIVY